MIHSFGDDSLFTEDVLDNVCKFELAVQNGNSDCLENANQSKRLKSRLASAGEDSLKGATLSNKDDVSSIQSVNVLRQEELEGKENKHITPRFSKRILNKCKLQNITKTLNNSNSLQRTVQELSALEPCNIYNASNKKDSFRNKKTIISKTSTPKTYNNERKNETGFHKLRNGNDDSCNRQSILTGDISNFSFENTVIEDNEKENVVGSINNSIEVSSSLSSQDKLDLSYWGLPEDVLIKYKENGISSMFPWQVECLRLPGVLDGCNLVYSAPTSAGKTLVAEILLLKRVLEQKKKGVFILPFVSIAREKTYSLQRLFGVAGVRVEGFMGGQSPPGGFQKTDIAICTIEKANNIINKLIEDQKLGDLGVIVVDELHMVGDPHRGYLLELLLTKLQYVASLKKEELQIQVIGMSATLPNLHVLAQWQKGKYYSTSYRPIPLLQMVKIGSTLYNEDFSVIRDLRSSEIKIKDDGEHLIQLCLETVLEGYSVLIFCPAKAWCEKVSLNIASSFYSIGKNNSGYPENIVQSLRNRLNEKDLNRIIEALRACPAGLDSVLERSLSFGAAFHHAGLTFDERDIIEGAFRAGYVPVLVATSTLSSGVNLPARRVIIRSPNAGGQLMDPLVYKQMVGRAGRKGKDTRGESILLCAPNEKFKAEKLVTAMLPPVHSCLQRNNSLSTSIKRAILEIVVSGAAKSVHDITLYWNCTLLAATTKDKNLNKEDDKSDAMPLVEECVQYLLDNELARVQEVDGKSILTGTQLGSAIMASGLSPDEGLHVFSELQRARQCFVLENELHVVYQVTPIYVSDSWPNLDWLRFLEIWETLSEGMKKVGQLVGIQENFLVRAMKGTVNYKIAKQRNMLAIHQRFYASLALHDLVHEVSLQAVAAKYGATKGLLQALQQSAATFAGMVAVFCNRLGWHNLELLIAQYQNRLQFGIQRDLCDLVKLSLLNGFRARLLFDSGYHSVNLIAHSKPEEISNILRNAGPFKSCKGLTSSEGFILGPDGAPLSITEAAKSIVLEARNLVQKELGLNVIEWDNENPGLTSVHLDEIHLSQFDSGLGEEKSGKNEPAINESKKRLHSENSNEQRRVKSPKLSKGEDERGKDVPSSDCKLIANPVDIIKESSCSMEKNLRSESEYASKGSVGSIDLNDSKCKTQEKTVENLLVTNNEKFELSSHVSKAKPKGSFLFSKSSRSLQVSSENRLVPEVPPGTRGKVTTENTSKDVKTNITNEEISKLSKVPIITHSEEREASSVGDRKSTLLSESMKAAFLNTLIEDDLSFMSKVERSNRDSTQSEDFFNIHSDEEEEKMKTEEISSINNENLQTDVYSACAEKIDFGFDLSNTGKGSSKKYKNVRNLDDSIIFPNGDCNVNFNDSIGNISGEESILMTESGALSLTRENIEKDLNDFDSSLINCANKTNNLEDSKTDLFLDNDFENDSLNESDKLNIAVNSRFSPSKANSPCKLSVSSDFSTLILTPGTEDILDDVSSPGKIESKELLSQCNKEENFDSEDCLANVSSHSVSFGSQKTRTLSIIDVASDEKLFKVFIKEWRSQNKFSLSIMCEKVPDRQEKCKIGWRVSGRSRRTPLKNDVSGIIIERTQLLLTGIAVCWGSSDSYFINLKTFKEESSSKEPAKDKSFLTPPISQAVSLEQRIDAIRTVLCNGTKEKTIKMWNAKETLKSLHRSGIAVSKFLFHDPRVAHWLLDPTGKQKSLHSMVLTYCEEYSNLLENIGVSFGTGSTGISCSEGESLRIKACTESVLVYHLTEAFRVKLSSSDLLSVWEFVEMPSLFNFTLMELNGMGFSIKECNEQKRKMQEKLDLLEAEAFNIIGRPFSLSSPTEVSKIIYKELNLETPVEQQRASLRQVSLRKKRIVQGPTNKETLMKLKDKHPLPGIVLEWRRINSALTKVVYPLSQEMVSCIPLGEERIFPVCHTFTATGRVTFHEPNVQNIPKDFVIELPDQENKRGDKNARSKVDFTPVMRQLAPFLDPVQCSTTYTVSLRHSIVAGKNRILLAADYSQLELRILAHLSSDSHLLKVLNDGEDVFKNIASQIYSIEVGEVTDTMRQEAKQICYGIIYGMSDKTLGEQLDITEEEAKDFMKQFHGKFPSISKFIQGTVEEARKNGYVVTLEKRKRFLPEINSPSLAARGQSERQAVNTCIQGSAADIVKKALISIQESLVENFSRAPLTLTQRLKGEETLSGGYLILQLHDELIYEVSNDDVIQVAQIVKISMEKTVKLSVSLPVKIKVGPTWGSMQTLNL